ncbi:hypothetical protein ACVME8_010773 [Bradyrhizobium diazoefficiens]
MLGGEGPPATAIRFGGRQFQFPDSLRPQMELGDITKGAEL